MTLKEAMAAIQPLCTACTEPELSLRIERCCCACAAFVGHFRRALAEDIDLDNAGVRGDGSAMRQRSGLQVLYGWTDEHGFWDPMTHACLLPVEVRSIVCLQWLCEWAQAQLLPEFLQEFQALCEVEAAARQDRGRLI
ncbi:MAG: hypothetical protein ACE149_15635 [Armatimonadota bacterium]